MARGRLVLYFYNNFQSMLINYQSLVHDSTNTLFEFRDNSKSAIENVVTAIELFEEDEYLDALEILAENKTLADNMAAKSKLLADKSNQLCSMAGDALQNATKESNMTADKKARLLNLQLQNSRSALTRLDIGYA